MKEIPLTKGKIALVDDEDFELVNKWKWQHQKRDYAVRVAWGKQKSKKIYMHRLILGVGEQTIIDHKDGNGLNNQRSNLRICTPSQNLGNSKKRQGTSSKYKGVSYFPISNGKYERTKKWAVRIQCNGKDKSLGYFLTKEEAALAYNKKAKELFGEFARLNIIQ